MVLPSKMLAPHRISTAGMVVWYAFHESVRNMQDAKLPLLLSSPYCNTPSRLTVLLQHLPG